MFSMALSKKVSPQMQLQLSLLKTQKDFTDCESSSFQKSVQLPAATSKNLYHNLFNFLNVFRLMWTRLSTTITVAPCCSNESSAINAFRGMILMKIDGAKRVYKCRGGKILLDTLNPNTHSIHLKEN